MLRKLLAALSLGTAVLVSGDSPASAHNFDNNSAYVCAYAREWPYGSHVVLHSHPVAMGSGWVKYGCEGTDLNTYCLWTAVQSIFGITGQPQGCSDL